MSKVIVAAQVQDLVKWEQKFRTHGELFKSYTVNRPVSYGTMAGNQVAVCFEPDNLETCLKMINSPVTGEAMAADAF